MVDKPLLPWDVPAANDEDFGHGDRLHPPDRAEVLPIDACDGLTR